MTQTQAPKSLFKNDRATEQAVSLLQQKSVKASTLFDLMYDGFYALFLLKNGAITTDLQAFEASMLAFLQQMQQQAKKLDIDFEDIQDAQYAFCAAVDELVLRSNSPIRSAWELKPLQLTFFGDQLAGEHFFEKLEQLRARGAARLQALEVYHMCLLMGFQGKYLLESNEKLQYLTACVGDEIAAHKGKFKGFSPKGERPDQFMHRLRHEVPLWFIASLFVFLAVVAFTVLRQSLGDNTLAALTPYNDIVQLAPKAANITIIFP